MSSEVSEPPPELASTDRDAAAHPGAPATGSAPRPAVRRPFYPAEAYRSVAPELAAAVADLPPAFEGHVSPQQAEMLFALVRLLRPEVVVETGLGVGHSACVVLEAQRSAGVEPFVVSVDVCAREETRAAAAHLGERYPRFLLVEGDSREVLAGAVHRVLRREEGLRLRLAILDGGHDEETVSSDLRVLHSFLALGGYLWLDDFEKVVPNPGVNAAGREFARAWGSCVRFRAEGNRGMMLYQKAF